MVNSGALALPASTPLLPHATPLPANRTSKRSLALVLSLFAVLALLLPNTVTSLFSTSVSFASYGASSDLKGQCAQATPVLPSKETHDISSVWKHKDEIVQWHQGVIRIPTPVQDEMGEPGVDKRWDVFQPLHEYLERAYPLVHKNLKQTKVDTYALIYEWFGSDESLQPLFLTAHQDVVPVLADTLYQWKQDPWNATYDGKWIWGRGSEDDKSGLTSILASIELLLRSDFKPRRTVILGFGHDEERGGQRGAPAIRDWLLENYGPDSMSLLVDEGSGIDTTWGRTFGLPAVAEKGKYNLNLTLSTLGGHSSIPPRHTNIGLMSLLVAQLERHPHPVTLERTSPIWGFMQCAAAYAPDVPKKLKHEVQKSVKSDKAFSELPGVMIADPMGTAKTGPGQGNVMEALMTTTQAVDLIQGGVKVNALPEVVTAVVNHRVDITASIHDVTTHIWDTLLPIAEEFGLSVSDEEGRSFTPKSAHAARNQGHITLSSAFEVGHGPAPISPTDLGSAAWRVLAGTSRGVWASRPAVSKDGSLVHLDEKDELVMSPFMSTGNTDTRRYWDLTRNIYRWRYFPASEGEGGHTINERVSADAMVEFTRFYQALILNVDASEEL